MYIIIIIIYYNNDYGVIVKYPCKSGEDRIQLGDVKTGRRGLGTALR